jgi:8-oxo-dGTP diphosphatase
VEQAPVTAALPSHDIDVNSGARPRGRRTGHAIVTARQILAVFCGLLWRGLGDLGEIALVKVLRAAGGIVWRQTASGPRLAVVHRARRADWSLPKGRLDQGETWRAAARREVAEETGCDVRLGAFAGAKLYVDRPEPKLVLYWHMEAYRVGPPEAGGEVDEVAWLSRREALARLDHGSDRRLLLRALAATRCEGGWTFPDAGSRPGTRASDLRSLIVRDVEELDHSTDPYLTLVARAAGQGFRAPARRA